MMKDTTAVGKILKVNGTCYRIITLAEAKKQWNTNYIVRITVRENALYPLCTFSVYELTGCPKGSIVGKTIYGETVSKSYFVDKENVEPIGTQHFPYYQTETIVEPVQMSEDKVGTYDWTQVHVDDVELKVGIEQHTKLLAIYTLGASLDFDTWLKLIKQELHSS